MRFVSVALIAGALLLVAPQAGARDRAESPAVTSWIDIQLAEIASHRTNPPRAARGLALTSVAMLGATKVPRAWQPAAVAGAAATAYVSGHSTTSAAASEVLSAFFPGDRKQLRAWAEEAALSRLYGGIHFRSDNEAGLELGERVGRVAVSRYEIEPLPYSRLIGLPASAQLCVKARARVPARSVGPPCVASTLRGNPRSRSARISSDTAHVRCFHDVCRTVPRCGAGYTSGHLP